MKQRRAVFALGILMIVGASLLAGRRFARRARLAHPAPSAHASPKPKLALSASARLAPPPPPLTVRPPYLDSTANTLAEQRAALFSNMRNQLDLPPGALDEIEAIFEASNRLGQGEPKITKHPMTRAECRAIR